MKCRVNRCRYSRVRMYPAETYAMKFHSIRIQPDELFRLIYLRIGGQKYDTVSRTRSMWFRLGASGGLLWMWHWTVCFHKMWGIVEPSHSVSQEGACCTTNCINLDRRGDRTEESYFKHFYASCNLRCMKQIARNQFLRYAWHLKCSASDLGEVK